MYNLQADIIRVAFSISIQAGKKKKSEKSVESNRWKVISMYIDKKIIGNVEKSFQTNINQKFWTACCLYCILFERN